ncbi:hypothetical protein [Massilia sp. Root335]|uniref:hypothetical protein n=1 Tax=Massilia sp. Root335 TaxID=1736517 RepID=UPI000A7C79CA|nr:hypothetical protein [Massilia sp. Root335]
MTAVRIRNLAVPDDFGTLSCLVHRNGEYAVLCVAHVLAPPLLGVDPSMQPVVACDVGQSSEVGLLRNWDMPVSSSGVPYGPSLDAAVAGVSVRTAQLLGNLPDFLPSALRTAPLALQETVHFTGASSGMRHTTVVHDTDARTDVSYFLYDLGRGAAMTSVDVSLRGLIQTDLTTQVIGGDSGSLLRDGDDRAVGILVGTDIVRNYCYFSPLDKILHEFNATLWPAGRPIA